MSTDFDPDRPAGIPSSDAEHAEAHQRALDCRSWLATYGWPEPIYADSGNGAWLLYKLPDLENTAEWTAKIKRCLSPGRRNRRAIGSKAPPHRKCGIIARPLISRASSIEHDHRVHLRYSSSSKNTRC